MTMNDLDENRQTDFQSHLPCVLSLLVQRFPAEQSEQSEQCHVDAVNVYKGGGKRKPKVGNPLRVCGKDSRHFFCHCFAEVSQ